MNLTDGQMYQNQLDDYLSLVEAQIQAYRYSKRVDHQGLTECNLSALLLACDFAKRIVEEIERDCRIRDEYHDIKFEQLRQKEAEKKHEED